MVRIGKKVADPPTAASSLFSVSPGPEVDSAKELIPKDCSLLAASSASWMLCSEGSELEDNCLEETVQGTIEGLQSPQLNSFGVL